MSERELFLAALDIGDLDARARFLAEQCSDDPEKLQRLQVLLLAQEAAGSFLEQTAPGFAEQVANIPVAGVASEATSSHHAADTSAGAIIAGKYTLVEPIGEGGMGSVWRAKQTEPVKRFVAVKLIKAGMDSRQVLARFDAERQALALMDHPNIAKVLDGGLHDHRPFFVMELVKGTPITEFCDAGRLTPKMRLELFVQACQAIQHAHQKGIIHRDIKPSNVLVALYDDKPVVKVIDFGVAKATGGTLTEATIDTGIAGVVGTPQYMSPEQATFNNLDIDTRSDVYALGVLLYELLAGSPPFSGAELKKKGFLEILRVVREEEPPRPSTKLSTADALPSLSANRGTEPKKLTGLLRNELDWIVMKALEKDRTRRYETANGFAADVQRYLAGEPVVAHPPSMGYRLKKFVRRNRGQVIAASLVFVALLAGIVGTSWGLVQARTQEAKARRQEGIAREKEQEANEEKTKALAAAEKERNAKQREAKRADGEKKAKEEAERNLAFAKKGNEILGSVFAGLDPKLSYGTVAEFRDALKANLQKAVKELDGSAIGDPLVVAEMQNTLGLSLQGLGEYEQAITLFARAGDTRSARLGADHPDTLHSMSNLAVGYMVVEKLDKAVPLFEKTLRLRKARLGPDHPNTLSSMNNLATAYRKSGNLALALPLSEEALKLSKAKLGADHSDTLTCMSNLAAGYMAAGKLDLALPLFEATIKQLKVKLGPDHPHTLASMNNLALGYQNAGKLDLALPLYEESLKQMKAKLGPDHPNVFTSMYNLASSYGIAGKFDLALPLFEETLKLQKAKLGPDHPDTLRTQDNLAFLQRVQDSAARYQREREAHGETHINTLLALRDVAQLNIVLGQLDRAEPQLAEVLAGLADRGPEDEIRAFTVGLVGRCLTIREKTQPDDWRTFNAQSLLGGVLLGQKKYAEAEPLLVKGYEGMKARETTIPEQGKVRVPVALDRLIELYTATNKLDEVKKWQAERAKYPPAAASATDSK